MSVPSGMSVQGIAMLASSEAIVPFRYKDSVNIDTFGIGHTKNAGGFNPSSIPYGQEKGLDKVFEIFVQDLKKFEAGVKKALKGAKTSQTQFDAITHWHFNTGAVATATWVKSHIAGRYGDAATQIMAWKKPPEILGRREHEQKLYRSGVYASPIASVYPADSKGRIQWSKGKRINVLPIAKELLGANQASKKEDSSKQGAAGSGTAAAGSEGTRQVTAPTTPSDPATPDVPAPSSADWLATDYILMGIAIIGACALAYFLIRWLANRSKRRTHIKAAATLTQLVATEASDAGKDEIVGGHITSSPPDSD